MSNRKPPRKAKVYRAGAGRSKGRSRSGGGSKATPVALVLLGVLVVAGVGYAVQHYKPAAGSQPAAAVTAPKATEAPKSSSGSNGTGTAASPAPAATTPPAKQAEQPKAPAPDPAKQIADDRTHIDRSAGAAKTMLVTAVYSDGLKGGDALQPVEVRVPQSVSQIKTAAEQLVKAPEELKLYSGVPAGTKVLSADYDAKTGVATLDLSAEFGQVQAGDVARVKAEFVYTLTKVPGVKAVQLWVLGRPAMLHEWQWSKPISEEDVKAENLFQVAPKITFAPKP